MLHLSTSKNDLATAARILKQGGILGLPTETVYGLAGLASQEVALQKIFKVKARPSNHPLIVHISNRIEVSQWSAALPVAVDSLVQRLIDAFWPGPLSLILPAAPHVSPWVTGGQPKVALRMPAHPVALDLLGMLGGGVCAPSANRFGGISPTSAQHVIDDLGTQIDAIIDAGPCICGMESTILDLTVHPVVILRPGMISSEQLSEVLGFAPLTLRQARDTQSPGLLDKHYAPAKPLQLLTSEQMTGVNFTPAQPSVVLSAQPPRWPCHWLEMPTTAERYAQALYDCLRIADQWPEPLIYVETPPQHGLWLTIYDRLLRASH